MVHLVVSESNNKEKHYIQNTIEITSYNSTYFIGKVDGSLAATFTDLEIV